MKGKPNTATPKLRFPEFKGSTGWARTKLSTVLTDHGLSSDGKCEVHSVSLTNGVVPQIEHMGRSYAATSTSHYSLVRPFDIVYTRSPLALFKLGIVKQHKRAAKAIVSPLYGVFTPKNRHLGLIIEAYFESPSRCALYLEPLAQKGAKNTIQLSNDRFLSGSLFLPDDEEEQREIADCLTSLDKLIAAEGRELEALRAYKKGLVQRLFPREGTTRPRLRLPEYQEAVGWEVGPLNKVLLEHKDKSDGAAEVHSVSVHAGLINQIEHLGRRFAASDTSHYSLVRPFDVVYTKSPTGEFPYGIVKQSRLSYPVIVSPLYGVFSPKHRALGYLIDAYFESPARAGEFLAPISNKGAKNTIQITNATFLSGSLPLPLSLDEAEQIADYLGFLDDLIRAQANKTHSLKDHKNGLMQGLFPAQEGT